MVKIRLGYFDLEIDENDIILDNGSCYVLITKELGSGRDSHHPIISKTDFNDLRTHGFLYTNNELRLFAWKQEKSTNVTYWKFKMALMYKWYT